jgi:hypothetical protein
MPRAGSQLYGNFGQAGELERAASTTRETTPGIESTVIPAEAYSLGHKQALTVPASWRWQSSWGPDCRGAVSLGNVYIATGPAEKAERTA